MVTRTQLVRLLPLTCSLLQFSPNTAANCSREQSPAPGMVTETTIVEQSPATEPCRVELPKELSKDVIELSCESTAKSGVCDVYLVGVIHDSKVNSYLVILIVVDSYIVFTHSIYSVLFLLLIWFATSRFMVD